MNPITHKRPAPKPDTVTRIVEIRQEAVRMFATRSTDPAITMQQFIANLAEHFYTKGRKEK